MDFLGKSSHEQVLNIFISEHVMPYSRYYICICTVYKDNNSYTINWELERKLWLVIDMYNLEF